MDIQCKCGKFRAELAQFPKNTPGRLKCYCNDCQAFLKYLNHSDLMDENGGTEIVPAYPADIQLISGKDILKCVRLSPTGMFRFYASCCNTPIANTDPVRPWVGILRGPYIMKDPNILERELGPIKSSVMGKHAIGKPPAGTPQTYDFNGMKTVVPFLIKGKLFGKSKPSPFFENGEAIVTPKILTTEERLKY